MTYKKRKIKKKMKTKKLKQFRKTKKHYKKINKKLRKTLNKKGGGPLKTDGASQCKFNWNNDDEVVYVDGQKVTIGKLKADKKNHCNSFYFIPNEGNINNTRYIMRTNSKPFSNERCRQVPTRQKDIKKNYYACPLNKQEEYLRTVEARAAEEEARRKAAAEEEAARKEAEEAARKEAAEVRAAVAEARATDALVKIQRTRNRQSSKGLHSPVATEKEAAQEAAATTRKSVGAAEEEEVPAAVRKEHGALMKLLEAAITNHEENRDTKSKEKLQKNIMLLYPTGTDQEKYFNILNQEDESEKLIEKAKQAWDIRAPFVVRKKGEIENRLSDGAAVREEPNNSRRHSFGNKTAPRAAAVAAVKAAEKAAEKAKAEARQRWIDKMNAKNEAAAAKRREEGWGAAPVTDGSVYGARPLYEIIADPNDPRS